MSFPLPPNSNRQPKQEHIEKEPKQKSGEVSENEVHFILKTTLLPEHHEDPNVLKFIAAYMKCRDQVRAAKEAGLTGPSGRVLRARPDIHEAITRLTAKSLMKYGFDASEIVEKVKEIAMIDPIEFENADGSFKTSMREIAPEARSAIKKFKAKNIYETDPNGMRVCVGQLIEVELWDKMKGIELLGREKDLFKETRKIEHDVTSNMADILLAAKKRGEDAYVGLREGKQEVIEVLAIEAPKESNEPS